MTPLDDRYISKHVRERWKNNLDDLRENAFHYVKQLLDHADSMDETETRLRTTIVNHLVEYEQALDLTDQDKPNTMKETTKDTE